MKRLVVTAATALLLAASGTGPAAVRDIEGKPAPEFTGALLSGEAVSLSAHRGKTPVVLTFWSIYCKSCTEEISALQRLVGKYGPEQVTVIAVNEDGDVGIDRVRNFLDRFAAADGGGKVTLPVLFDGKGEVFRKYSIVHLPTLVYIDRDGTVRSVVEGYGRGSELAVTSAIEKLIRTVSPEPLKEVAAEAVYDLDVTAPICGVYRDGTWFRPLDLDESGRPEAVARARAQGEDYLRREAVRFALARLGISLDSRPRPPACEVPYGLEIRTPRYPKDALDLFMERLDMPRVMEVVSQDTVERDRDLVLYRRIRIHLPALREQLQAGGYTVARATLRIRFARASHVEERAFLDAVGTRFPYLASLRSAPSPRGKTEYLLECHASPGTAVEKLRTLDVGARKLSVELLPGDIAEVAMWR